MIERMKFTFTFTLHYIFFGNKSRLKKLDNKTVKYLGTPLERKKEAKYLGVIFDEKMSNNVVK